MLIIHVKKYINNLMVIISEEKGRVVFFKSAGVLGYNHMQKRSLDALIAICREAATYIVNRQDRQAIYFRMEGVSKTWASQILKYLVKQVKKKGNWIQGVCSVQQIAHNGCRKNT